MGYRSDVCIMIHFNEEEEWKNFKMELLIHGDTFPFNCINRHFEIKEDSKLLVFFEASIKWSEDYDEDEDSIYQVYQYFYELVEHNEETPPDIDGYYGVIGEELTDLQEDTFGDGYSLNSIVRGFSF